MHQEQTIEPEDLARELLQDLEIILFSLPEPVDGREEGHVQRSPEEISSTESLDHETDVLIDPDPLAILKDRARKRIESFLEQLQNWHLAELSAEKVRFSHLTIEAEEWRRYFGRVLELVAPMSAELDRFTVLLDGSRMSDLPESTVHQLINRKQNIDIICRMMEALPSHHQTKAKVFEPLELQIKEVLSVGDLPSLALVYEPVAVAISDEQNKADNEPAAVVLSRMKQSIHAVIQEGENIREANARQINKLEDKVRKSKEAALDFIKRSLLSVVDGVERGGKQWESLKDDTTPGSQQAELIQQYMAAHCDLENALFQHLQTIDIYRLVAEYGQPFDVGLHNPVYLEESSDLGDGAVLEMTRSGYRYKEDMLRPIDVILARNKAALPAAPLASSATGDEVPDESMERNFLAGVDKPTE